MQLVALENLFGHQIFFFSNQSKNDFNTQVKHKETSFLLLLIVGKSDGFRNQYMKWMSIDYSQNLEEIILLEEITLLEENQEIDLLLLLLYFWLLGAKGHHH